MTSPFLIYKTSNFNSASTEFLHGRITLMPAGLLQSLTAHAYPKSGRLEKQDVDYNTEVGKAFCL